MLGRLREEGVTTVTAHIHPDNAPSESVARALGLAPTATIVDGEVRWKRLNARKRALRAARRARPRRRP